MKVSLYFFDKYTSESIWIAIALWPLYFIIFYLFFKSDKDKFNKNLILPLISSLIVASFTALVFADTLIEYLVFFLGFGILLFGSISKINPNKKSAGLMILGIFITVLAGFFLYLMRTKLYNRTSIPKTPGYIDFKDKSYWTWIIIQTIMYVYVLWYMIKH
jgi:predicted permease